MKSGDEKDYERLICSICTYKDFCKKDKIKLYNYGDRLTMNCIEYKFESSPID